MTKEQVQTRLAQLTTEREQLRASLAAYEGAIQDCNYWLQQLETPQPSVEVQPVAEPVTEST